MLEDTLDEVLNSVPREIVDASRSDDCRPGGVLALAQGRKLPRRHHALGCLACQFDAVQLRKQYAITEPALPLSLLMTTRWAALSREDGMRVQFSDRSTARLRLRPSGDSIEVVIDKLRVTGRMAMTRLALETRGQDCESSVEESQEFKRIGRSEFCATIRRANLHDSDVRFLIRLHKAVLSPDRPSPGRTEFPSVMPVAPHGGRGLTAVPSYAMALTDQGGGGAARRWRFVVTRGDVRMAEGVEWGQGVTAAVEVVRTPDGCLQVELIGPLHATPGCATEVVWTRGGSETELGAGATAEPGIFEFVEQPKAPAGHDRLTVRHKTPQGAVQLEWTTEFEKGEAS